MLSYLFKKSDPKTIIPFKSHESNKSVSIKVSQFEDTEIVKNTPISNVVNTVRILGLLSSNDIEFLKYLDQETLYNIILEYNLALTFRLAMQNRNRVY
jgi:hypothetical protein